GVSVPLFSGRRNEGDIRAARAAVDEVPLRREAALLNLHTQLHRAFSGRQQAVESVAALRGEVIPLLTRALAETRDAYERGLYSYTAWVAARQELIEARRATIAAASAALRYGAHIEQLTAENLSVAQ